VQSSKPGSHIDSGSDAGDLLAGYSHRFAREEGKDLSGADDLANALRQGLALLARQQPPKFILACQNFVRNLLQRFVALLRRRARIGRKCRLRGSNRRFGLGGLRTGVIRDHVVQV
jgi:hypothetical protein